jgi:Tfp pilus assembly protein PilN
MLKINLLKIRVPKEKLVVRRQVLAFIVTVIATVVLAGMWSNSVYAAKSAIDAKLEAEKAKLAKLQSVTRMKDEFESKEKRQEQVLEAIKNLSERKSGPRPYLDELNLSLPPDIWLTEVSAQNASLAVTGYSFSNAAIADLMRGMERSDQFQDVDLSGIQNEMVQKENVKKFTVTGNIKPLYKLILAQKEADKKEAERQEAEKKAHQAAVQAASQQPAK